MLSDRDECVKIGERCCFHTVAPLFSTIESKKEKELEKSMPRYQPADALQLPRFSGIRTFARLPHVIETVDVDATVLGIPFDTGVSFRSGARFGPAAIRDASILLRPYNAAAGVDVFGTLSVTDGGDLPVVPGYIDDSYARIAESLLPILQAGVIPICLAEECAPPDLSLLLR